MNRFEYSKRGRIQNIVKISRSKWMIGLHKALICVLVITMMPIIPAPQPVLARGIGGFLSKVVPFAGVVVGLNQRNRVYRSSEHFISDRNQYYDGLLAMARQQLLNNEITTIGRTRAAAYIKVYAMIEQERAGQLAVAEARKREARAQFQDRVKDAIIYAAAGGRIAREVVGSMLKGVNSMESLLDRAINKITSGGSDFLKDVRRVREIASMIESASSIIGGKLGAKLGGLSAKIVQAINQGEMGSVELLGLMKGELQVVKGELNIVKELGRRPTAGEVIDHVKGRFLPGEEPEGSIPLEAISVLLSEMKAGDGSLKDEARRALNAGFSARCAFYASSMKTQIKNLNTSDQPESSSEGTGPECKAVNPKNQEESDSLLDQILEISEDEDEEKEDTPLITASGTISEAMSGALNSTSPMGTTFQLTADYSTGSITGSLTGSRTSTPGGWMNCFDPDDPSNEFDRIDVNTTEAYQASFSGAIDKETGEFSIEIAPVGQTSAEKVSLFTHERCLNLNSKKYSGEGGWTGKGTLSGGVSKDGGIELSTSWAYSWFKGQVDVNGSWSGNGIVSQPEGE